MSLLLRLKGDFENLIDNLPAVNEAINNALRQRPDLQGAKAMEKLAVARLNQARAESKVDARKAAKGGHST